jgi:hypothetical protein
MPHPERPTQQKQGKASFRIKKNIQKNFLQAKLTARKRGRNFSITLISLKKIKQKNRYKNTDSKDEP